MLHAPALRPARRLTAALAALLCVFLTLGPVAPAFSQLVAPAQTKEEAKKAEEDAEKAANDDGGGISVEAGLAITAILLIGGATVYMLRDSKAAAGGDERRAPVRPAANPRETRGAPKNMFEGEAKPGGQVGKQNKRSKGKRQRQARKANRPR